MGFSVDKKQDFQGLAQTSWQSVVNILPEQETREDETTDAASGEETGDATRFTRAEGEVSVPLTRFGIFSTANRKDGFNTPQCKPELTAEERALLDELLKTLGLNFIEFKLKLKSKMPLKDFIQSLKSNLSLHCQPDLSFSEKLYQLLNKNLLSEVLFEKLRAQKTADLYKTPVHRLTPFNLRPRFPGMSD